MLLAVLSRWELFWGIRATGGRLFGRRPAVVYYSAEVARVPSELRPYQEECIATSLLAYANGVRRQAVSLPVGSGKTVIFANLIARLQPPTPEATRVLVLAHREELLFQAERQIRRFAPHLRCSIEKGKQHSGEDTDVVIASVPTLGRVDAMHRLRRLDPAQFKAIIIDEAHHSVAATYMRIFRHFRVIGEGEFKDEQDAKNIQPFEALDEVVPGNGPVAAKPSSDLLVWGCSATLSRNDELVLGHVFERIVYHKDLKSMMEEGWLCPAETKEIYTHIDLQKVALKGGDFDQKQLSLAIDTPTRNDLVAGMWLKIAKEQYQRRATIVFALNVQHAQNLAAAFAKLAITTAIITGKTADVERTDTLERFARGEIAVLLNCAVLTEGTDLPITDCVVMTRPTCNTNLYIQMVGRGLRKHPEKQSCLVLDFIDRFRSKSRTLISFPSLVAARDVPSSGTCKESAMADDDGEEKGGGGGGSGERELDVNIVSVRVRSKSHEETLKVSDPGHGLAWVCLDAHNFALDSKEGTFLLEVHPDNPGLGKLFALRKTSPAQAKRRVQYERIALSPEDAWHPIGESLGCLRKDLQEREILHFFTSNTFWRTRYPATAQQKAFLLQILTKISGVTPTHLQLIHQWSVGKAADYITKYQLRSRFLRRPFKDIDDFIAGATG